MKLFVKMNIQYMGTFVFKGLNLLKMNLRGLFFMFSIVPLIHANLMQNSNNYGPFAISDITLTTCPILKESKLFGVNVSMNDNFDAVITMSFIEKIKLTSLKVSVHNETQGQKSFLWNYKVKDPCKHIVYAVFLKNYLIADNNCYVKPGVYRTQLNIKDVMTTVFGTSFFYGHYFTKSDLSSKSGLVACFVNSFTLNKK